MNEYDVLHYDLSIAFDFQNKSFNGAVEVHLQVLNPLRQIVLSASNETLTIDSVFFDNSKVSYTHSSDHLIISLPSMFNKSKDISIIVYYHGASNFTGNYDNGGIYFSSSDRVATISEPWFARNWWPCKDVPSDKATATISITVPDSLTAVSNGILKKIEHHNGKATFHWSTEYPMSTYLLSIAVAKYSESSVEYKSLDGKAMKVFFFVFPEDSEKAKTDFRNILTIMEYFRQIFGEYPFLDEKLGFAEIVGDMTMENQTICSIQKDFFTGDRQYELTFAHEIAHHWFGNMLTPENWHHTWLNEGFATYAEALYLEHRRGSEVYQLYINSMMMMKNGTYAGSVIGKSDTAFWDSFSPAQSYKGAIVLHMLRKMLGDSVFFNCIKRYVKNTQLRYRNVTTQDFISVCELASGKNLKWFFNQWVYSPVDSIDRPVLDYTWETVHDKSKFNIALTIEQKTADKILYRLPLTVSITTMNSTYNYDVIDSVSVQSFNLSVKELPTAVEIDKENKIFKIINKK
jgi:aminopeptidase N